GQARGAVNAHHRLADLEGRGTRADGSHPAGVAMTEGTGHGDLRMPTRKRLPIGAGHQRPLDLEQHLPSTGPWHGVVAQVDPAGLDQAGVVVDQGAQRVDRQGPFSAGASRTTLYDDSNRPPAWAGNRDSSASRSRSTSSSVL